MNFRLLFFKQTNQVIVLLDGLHGLDKNRLPRRAGPVYYSGHSPFLLDLDRDDKTLAANRDQFILHRSALGEPAQIPLERLLNVAPLLLDFATNSRQLRRSPIVQASVRQQFVPEVAYEFAEVGNSQRQLPNSRPI